MHRSALRVRFAGQFFLVTAVGALACLSGGCGGGPSLAPVSGKVTLNDKPLTTGNVVYYPNKAKGNTFTGLPVGEINSQGEYTLQTGGKPGAPLGAYKVTVSATPTTPDNTKPSTKNPVNPQFGSLETTPLQVDVVEKAAPGAYDLKVGR